ncbi:MAG: transposase [Clostridiales bacterium]|jgi:transposase|nr:transposase [Clostridiales bacterium]
MSEKSLKSNQSTANLKTVVRTVKQYSKPLPAETMEFLTGIAKDYAKVKAYVYARYSGIGSLGKIYPGFTVINEINLTGLRQELNLPYDYYSIAILDALGSIKSEWSKLKAKIISLVRQNENLTDAQRHYIYAVLKQDKVYSAVLNRQELERPATAAADELSTKKLNNLICRLTRKYKTKPEANLSGVYFKADKHAYRYKKGGITLASRTPYERVFIPLTDKCKYTKQITVRINEKNAEINIPVESKVKTHEDYINKVALHIGYSVMLTTSGANEYGGKLGALLSERANRISGKLKARGEYYATVRKYTQSGNIRRAKTIEQNNLGRIKFVSQNKRELEQIKSYINEEINRMIETEKPGEVVIPAKNKMFSKHMSKESRYKLSRWLVGFIRERLKFKCALHNIQVKEVSAAYTVSVCEACGAAGQRTNMTFVCGKCEAKIPSALNAARNFMKKADGVFNIPECLLKNNNCSAE